MKKAALLSANSKMEEKKIVEMEKRDDNSELSNIRARILEHEQNKMRKQTKVL